MAKTFLAGLLLVLSFTLQAADIKIAVASNFMPTMRVLAEHFQQQTGNRLILSAGSTGKHYAQIINGAPFDVFLAADSKRPQLLDQQGKVVNGQRFTYARGQLVLWSPQPSLVDDQLSSLKSARFNHLAIANPKLAPYGRAAQQVLQAKSLWQPLQGKMVRGENIGQAFQFVQSGNAELGFVALSQIKALAADQSGSWWLPPQALYQNIDQQAVLLTANPIASQFMAFLQHADARQLIQQAGYEIPDA